MIIIRKNETEAYFPKHNFDAEGPYTLKCVNTSNNSTTTFFNLIDTSDRTRYYKFVETYFDILETGEYEYNILSGDDVIENGLLRYGNYKRETTEYQSNIVSLEYDPEN